MTIFGYDVSSYQHGMDVAGAAGDFMILKCTEGIYYVDADYPAWVPVTHGAGKLPIAYHFVKTESSPAAQAAWLAAHIGNLGLPVMLDVEPNGASRPDVGFVLQVVDTMRLRGLNVRLVYLPHWYWEQLGSPDLGGLAARQVGLVSSSYPGGSGYPGDSGAGWTPYGGMTPLLWQFTDAPVDNNAFRGSIEELRNFLEGTEVNLSDTIPTSAGFAARYPLTASDGFTAGANISVATLLEGAAIRAANNEHLLQQILGKVGAPAAVDVNALAAALEPHLNDPANSAAIAQGVVAHLGLEVVTK